MQVKKTDKLRLFGADIPVSETDSEDIGTSQGGATGTVWLPQESIVNIQEFDRKSYEVSASGDDHEDTSLRLSSERSSLSRIGDQCEKKGKFPEDEWALTLSSPQLDKIVGSSNSSMQGPLCCQMPWKILASNSVVLSGVNNVNLNFKPFQESDKNGTQDSAANHEGESSSRNGGKSSKEPNDKGIQNSSSNNVNSDGSGGNRSVKRKGKEVVSDDKEGSKSVKKRKTSSIDSHKTAEPLPNIEQVPRLLQIIESQNGSQPVFVYRKKLQVSDIRKDQNRVFLTKCEQLMEFLTEEERNSAYSTKEGLEIYAVDTQEKYYKLHLRKWGSLCMPVLKSQWHKLVQENNVETGSWTEMWAYRLNEKIRLAVNFRKPAEEPAEALRDEAPNEINNGGN